MENIDAKNIWLFLDSDCWERINLSRCPSNENSNAEQTYSQLQTYTAKYKVKKFELTHCCNINLSDLEKLCTLIIGNKMDIGWSAPAICNPKMDSGIIALMKAAGCTRLFFDIMSGSEDLLKKMGAGFTLKDISRILKTSHQAGIYTGIRLVIGHPQETRENFDATCKFLEKNRDWIDEITKVTYCLSSYFIANYLSLSTCRYWKDCLGSNGPKEASGVNFIQSMSKISSLGKPVFCNEPSEDILNYIINNPIHRFQPTPKIISKGRLRLAYASGGIKLHWNTTEISANIGFNTAVKISDKWIDSTRADWQMLQMGRDYFEFKMIPWHCPLIQNWKIKLESEYKVSWEVYTEFRQMLHIEELRILCLVNPQYIHWFNNYRQGEFSYLDDNWHDLCSEEMTVSLVGVRSFSGGIFLPSLTMETEQYKFFPLVQDAPVHTNAHVIGFRYKKFMEKNREFGSCSMFSGTLNLFESTNG